MRPVMTCPYRLLEHPKIVYSEDVFSSKGKYYLMGRLESLTLELLPVIRMCNQSTGKGAMLAPIRLGNAAAPLQLRCQPRRKETHPHPTQPHSRPYDITICRRSVSINVSTDVSEKSLNARYHGAVPAGRESIPGFHERQSSNSGDTAPGQTNGDGLFGMWFVTTPNLSVQGGGSTSGGYGY